MGTGDKETFLQTFISTVEKGKGDSITSIIFVGLRKAYTSMYFGILPHEI